MIARLESLRCIACDRTRNVELAVAKNQRHRFVCTGCLENPEKGLNALIASTFGWKSFSVGCDPWGSGSHWARWHLETWTPKIDPLMCVATAFSKGINYMVAFWTVSTAGTIKFAQLSGRQILDYLQLHYFLFEDPIRRIVPLTKDREWAINYTQPLPIPYVKHLLAQEYPFSYLDTETGVAVMARLMLSEQIRRSPESFHLADYIVSESPSIKETMKREFPYEPLPDKNAAFERLWKDVEGKIYTPKDDDEVADTQGSIYELLKDKISKGYDNPPEQQALPPMGPFNNAEESWEALMHYQNEEGKRLDARLGSEAQAREMLLDIQAAAIDGKLPNYLATVASHDRSDEERKNQSIAEHEVALGSETDEHEVHKISPLDRLAYQDWFEEEWSPSLEEMNLPIDQLTPGEKRVLQEVLQAEELGYIRSSKTGKSYREFWGKDYNRKIKMLERAKAKLKAAMSTTGKSEQ